MKVSQPAVTLKTETSQSKHLQYVKINTVLTVGNTVLTVGNTVLTVGNTILTCR